MFQKFQRVFDNAEIMKASTAVFLLVNIIINTEASRIFVNDAYGYFKNVGIPKADAIRKAEEARDQISLFRIAGGAVAETGQFVYQAGLLVDILNLNGTGVCGGSIISADRVLTAAHCWYDGVHQGYRVTVVLGSNTLFSGGLRLETAIVHIHPKWSPSTVRNDLAVVYLPEPVKFTDNIGAISLPYGRDLCQNFVGYTAKASGYGRITDNITTPTNEILNQVNLTVIKNAECAKIYNGIITHNHLCTVGPINTNVCNGDSGGPLVTIGVEGELILIGVTSFGSPQGCESNNPAGYSRVTSFMDFIKRHIESIS